MTGPQFLHWLKDGDYLSSKMSSDTPARQGWNAVAIPLGLTYFGFLDIFAFGSSGSTFGFWTGLLSWLSWRDC